MIEKKNTTLEKRSAGDAHDIDDIVDLASSRMSRVHMTDPRKRMRVLTAAPEAADTPCA